MNENNIVKQTYGLTNKINKIEKINKKLFLFTKLNKKRLKPKNTNISLLRPDVKKLKDGNNRTT